MITHSFSPVRAVVLACAFAATAAFAADIQPAGYVDFGQLTPSARGELVEVNLQPGLLKIAAAVVALKDPEAAALIRSLQRIRVNVVQLDNSNRASTTERMNAIREKLTAQGWTQAVTVREQKGSNVDVHVKARGDEALDGLVITVIDHGRRAVFVNIVGDIRPEQIAKVTKHLHIKGLEKLEHKKTDETKPGV